MTLICWLCSRGESRRHAFLKGAFRGALWLAMDEAIAGMKLTMNLRQDGAWKFFFMLPRMLLQRPGWGGVVLKEKIQERLTAFAAGQWAELIRESIEAMRRKRRRESDNLVKRAAWAEKSAGRQALEGAEVAPGTLRTLTALMIQTSAPHCCRSHFGSRRHLSQTLCCLRTRRAWCSLFSSVRRCFMPRRLVDSRGPRWVVAVHQGAASEVGEVASQVISNPSEAGISSSSVSFAGEQGACTLCETCNGARTAGHGARGSTNTRKGFGSHDRRGGASSGCAPCRIEEGARCSGGASFRRPDRTQSSRSNE